NLAQARSALIAGDGAKAVKLLRGEGTSLPVRYLRARALWQAGRLDSAAEELELLAVHYAPMRDRCRYDAGLLHQQRGDLARADTYLSAVSPSSTQWADARQTLSQVRRAQHDWAGAQDALKPLLDVELAPAVHSKVLWELGGPPRC